MDATSRRGMEAEVPLSKRTVYEGVESEETSVEESTVRGMSMTVPARSMWEIGSMRSTQVPGGYLQFLDGKIVVAIQGAEETTIVFHVPIDGSRETVGVNPIAIGFVVLFVAWIVD